MRVAFVSAEVHPFSKTGGLADVADALPRALTELGSDVTVFTPGYGTALARLEELGIASRAHRLPQELWIGDRRQPLSYRLATYEGRRVVFVCNPDFYHRPHLYLDSDGHDYADNVDRFAFFCRAVLELCLAEGAPDVFHANDWQAALIPVYLKTLYRDPRLAAARALFTIHNLAYQGLFGREMLYATGLSWDVFHPEGLEFWGRLNLMKGGIVFGDAVTTVSPTYAEEIQTPAHGKGLDGVMRAQRHKLRGILNGIDVRQWDPAADPHLPAHYSADDLGGKAACKQTLQQQFELAPGPQTFLLGAVGRFDVQKGIHLILEAFPRLAELDLQLVMLGAGDRDLEAQARQLAAAFPRRMGLRIGFDEALAHRIEAGADAFLMPSQYEPCGLNQMYSQRYGTIPIVHQTGGLKDTVIDFTRRRQAAGQASGFSFATFATDALVDAVRRAVRLYGEEPDTWRALMRNCMLLDHSWTTSARAYLALCEQLVPPTPPVVRRTP